MIHFGIILLSAILLFRLAYINWNNKELQVMMSDLILVTGANGFIASHIIKQLLEQDYHVRGTVRHLNDEVKINKLNSLVSEPKYPLELVEADLLNEDSWLDAVKGCSYVIHTASPVALKMPDNEDEFIKPAVNGTLNVLKACVEDGSQVKRIVLTSSISAITGDVYINMKTYSESDWPDVESLSAYSKSKVLAEKAAWSFISERREKKLQCFELVVLNPGVAFGPLTIQTQGRSIEIFRMLFERRFVPDIELCTCDVRDVALAHIRALTAANAVNHRHIISTFSKSINLLEYAAILREEFKPLGYRVALFQLPHPATYFISLFDRRINSVIQCLGVSYHIDNKRMKDVLGIQPVNFEKTLIEMGHDLINKDMIKKMS